MDNTFDNYGSVTTNGTQLGTVGTGLSTTGMTSTMPTGISGAATPDVSVSAPPMGGLSGGQQGQGMSNFFAQGGGFQNILGGAQVLGNLWASFQANKMAKEQMAFAREQWNTNLTNQTQTYNTALEDRIRGRYATGTKSEAELQSQIDENSL